MDQRNVQKTASSLPFDLDLFFPDYVGNLHVNITTSPSRGDNLFLVLGTNRTKPLGCRVFALCFMGIFIISLAEL